MATRLVRRPRARQLAVCTLVAAAQAAQQTAHKKAGDVISPCQDPGVPYTLQMYGNATGRFRELTLSVATAAGGAMDVSCGVILPATYRHREAGDSATITEDVGGAAAAAAAELVLAKQQPDVAAAAVAVYPTILAFAGVKPPPDRKRCETLEKLLAEGRGGVMSGSGFFDYGGRTPDELFRSRDAKLLSLKRHLRRLGDV